MLFILQYVYIGLPSAQLVKKKKKSACSTGVQGLIAGLERFPGEGNGNPFQYSCLENPMGRGAWRAIVHGVARVGHNLATKPPSCVYMCVCVCVYIKS